MKTILKITLGLLAGCLIGVILGLTAAVLFGGKTWSEVLAKIAGIDIKTVAAFLLWAFTAFVGFIAALLLQITIHEGGHLVAGLLTGYRFLSFRVLSLTLIKKDGHFQLRRYSLGSTGGQCLMAPPQRPPEETDTRWYNLSGVLANILLSTVALLVFVLCDVPSWANIFMIMTIAFGYYMALTNGIPMRIGGMNNDGYNLLHLEKNPADKRLLCMMLEANAQIQNGVQPKDLPDEMFATEEDIDWSDGMHANWQMIVATRLENQQRWEEAYDLLKQGMAEKEHIAKLFVQELGLELVYVCLVTGRTEEARELYTNELRNYLKRFAKTHSSKARIQYAITLLMDGNREEAQKIKEKLITRRNDFLMQGEVAMDIELVKSINS